MIKKLRNEKKYLFILAGIVIGVLFVYYLPATINNTAYVQGTDLRSQWYEFYYEFKRLIKDFIQNGNLPFYSWSTFLGNNFYASKGYYLIGDIYNYIGLILNDNFFIMAEEITCLKIFVSAFTFYIFLTEFDRKPITKITCSIAYAFSGFAIFFAEQMVFLSFYSLVPLYLLAIERYLKDNKWILFSVMCAILFATNFYFFYTLSALTPIYFIYRYFSLEKDKKDFFKSALKLIGYYALGSLISSFIWLPTVIYILNGNGRFLDGITLLHDPYVYIDYIISFFVPNYLYLNRGNMFDTYVYYNREICCWASTVLIVLLPQFKNIFSKTRKLLTIGMYVIFTIIAVFPLLCSILHGFSNPSFRWTFFIIIFNLLIISEVLDNLDLLDMKLLLKTILSYLAIIAISFAIGLYISGDISSYTKQIILVAIFSLLIIISYLIYRLKNIKIVLFAVLIEITLSGLYFHVDDLNNGRSVSNESMYRTIIQNYYGEVNDYLKSIDDDSNEFYRVYIYMYDVYYGFSLNANILYGINGVATYDTTYSPSISKLIELDPDINQYGLDWIVDINDSNLLDFLNTKYAITTAGYEIDLDKWELIDDNYGWGYYIYKNKSYKKFGITYSKSMTEDEYKKISDTSLFSEYVIADKETLDKISDYLNKANANIDNIDYQGNHLYANYSSDNDGFMIISIPYDEGWNIQVDGEEINYYNVNGGFIGFEIKEGTHEINMYFVPKGLKTGVALSAAGVVILVIAMIIDKRKKEYER